MNRESKHHAWRYLFIDGLVEIAFGTLFLLVASVFLLKVLGAPSQWMFHVIVFPSIPLMFFGAEKLRSRLTYLRTGYVVPRVPKHAHPKLFALFLLLGLLVNVLFALLGAASPEFREANAVVMLGLYTGTILAAFSFGLRRLQHLGAFAALLGAVASLLPMTSDGRHLVFCAVLGGVLLTSGVAVLRQYLKRTAGGRP